MSLLFIFAIFLQLCKCQTLPTCPSSNPISGVPISEFNGMPLCTCPGAVNPQAGMCANGGSCNNGQCTFPACPSTAATQVCNCTFEDDNELCAIGGTCSSSTGCAYNTCPSGSAASQACKCGLIQTCGPGMVCDPDFNSGRGDCNYPECTAHGTVLTSVCNCGSAGSCFSGTVCDQNPDSCHYPTCPVSNSAVTSNCTCGTATTCRSANGDVCSPTSNSNQGFCGRICPTGPTSYMCLCGTSICQDGDVCDAGSCSLPTCSAGGSSQTQICRCGTTATCYIGDICSGGSCTTPACAADGTAETFNCLCGSNGCYAGQACTTGTCTTLDCVDGVEPASFCKCNTGTDCNHGYLPTGCDPTGTAGTCQSISTCQHYDNTATCRCGAGSVYALCVAGQDCDQYSQTCTQSPPACPVLSPATTSCRCSTSPEVLCAVGDTCNFTGECDGPPSRASAILVPTLLAMLLVVILL